MSRINSLGVVGLGEFGRVAAEHLAPESSRVVVFDKNPNAVIPQHAERVGLSAIASADVVILAVPFGSYAELVPVLAEKMDLDSLLVDICSVKLLPREEFRKVGLLERENVLLTHPLFGPQSLEDGIDGRNIVITDQRGDLADQLVEAWGQKGAEIVTGMTAEEHDREMAVVHALTFFIGRALLEMGVEKSRLETNYFNKLLALIEVERHHSFELFDTIQRYNPFASEVRRQLLEKLMDLDSKVHE